MENVERELGKLVLSNLEMLEKSYDFLQQIDVQFYEKIENQFNAWYEDVKKNSEWPKTLVTKKIKMPSGIVWVKNMIIKNLI